MRCLTHITTKTRAGEYDKKEAKIATSRHIGCFGLTLDAILVQSLFGVPPAISSSTRQCHWGADRRHRILHALQPQTDQADQGEGR